MLRTPPLLYVCYYNTAKIVHSGEILVSVKVTMLELSVHFYVTLFVSLIEFRE